MSKDIIIKEINECVSDDGYYWDNYCQFDYRGETYSFSEIGSGSGWIPTSFYFGKGSMKRLFGTDLNRTVNVTDLSDFRFLEEKKIPQLISYLKKSRKDHLEYSENDFDKATDKEFLKILGLD